MKKLTTFSEGKEKCHDGDSKFIFKKEKKRVMTGTRTYTVQKKGCAERIAPIGTLSQNGYGERQRVYNGSYLTTNTSALSGAP